MQNHTQYSVGRVDQQHSAACQDNDILANLMLMYALTQLGDELP